MSMVEKLRNVDFAFDGTDATNENWVANVRETIAAALAEAERLDNTLYEYGHALGNAQSEIETARKIREENNWMNERAEQAGAEWTRAREAWRRRGDLVRSAFFAEDFDILDQFFGCGEEGNG